MLSYHRAVHGSWFGLSQPYQLQFADIAPHSSRKAVLAAGIRLPLEHRLDVSIPTSPLPTGKRRRRREHDNEIGVLDAIAPDYCIDVTIQLSRNARLKLSKTGCSMYCRRDREPRSIKSSAGIPDTSRTSLSPLSSLALSVICVS